MPSTDLPDIRVARPVDFPALHALERAAFGAGAYPGFVVRQILDCFAAHVLVAWRETWLATRAFVDTVVQPINAQETAP